MDGSDPSVDRTFRGHRGHVTSVCFNPNGRQVASGGVDGFTMLWNFKENMRAFKFVGHKGAVTHVQYSPSGHILASVRSKESGGPGERALLHVEGQWRCDRVRS